MITRLQFIVLGYLTLINYIHQICFNFFSLFQIRLEYIAPTLGYLLAISSITINLSEEILPECYRDDFSEDSPELIFSPCFNVNFNNFTKMQYSNTSLVEKPLGANDYFLTLPQNGKAACTKSPINFDLKKDSEVIFSIYTDNDIAKINRAFLFALDAFNDTIAVDMLPIEINDSRKWRTISMKINVPSKVTVSRINPITTKYIYILMK